MSVNNFLYGEASSGLVAALEELTGHVPSPVSKASSRASLREEITPSADNFDLILSTEACGTSIELKLMVSATLTLEKG